MGFLYLKTSTTMTQVIFHFQTTARFLCMQTFTDEINSPIP